MAYQQSTQGYGYAHDAPVAYQRDPHESLYEQYSHPQHGYTNQVDPYAAQARDDAYHYQQPSSHGHGDLSGGQGMYGDNMSVHSRTHLNATPHQEYPPPMPSPYAQSMPYQQQAPRSPYYENKEYFPTSGSGYQSTKEKMMRRRSVKQVALQQGNLVLDCPVPNSILTQAKQFPNGGPKEFTHMRYTACTVDPDDWIRSSYTFRQYMYGRQTELAIVITMYNEDEVLFCRSFNSVIKNIQNFQSKNRSKTWGPNSWTKISIVIVSDGRQKINKRTLNVIGLCGAYQDGIMKDTVAGKDVTAHVFEYTTQVMVDELGNVTGGISPVQVTFILKEKNAKKLNSHRWFFNAFCAQTNPNVCILIDAGTKPTGTSLHALYKVFEKHSHVGGACGEIAVDTGRACGNLINPLVAAQNFEYKMSNILDKPLESVFGYISVLPGAFSAYRFKALQGAPLQAYFLGEKMHAPGAHAGVFDSNMYLAEDRILCFAIVTKAREHWVLRYVKSAKAVTDCPTQIDDLIGQRRRWLNGSFFAALHATIFWWKIWTSGHNPFRKLWLTIEFLYNAVQLVFTLSSLANFYLASFFIMQAATSNPNEDPFGGQGPKITSIATNVYIALLFVILVCSLGNRPSGSKAAYTAVVVAFAAIFIITAYCTVWTIYLAVPHTAAGWRDFGALIKQGSFRDIVISLAATYALYFFASFIHLEPWHMFTSFIQYLLILPSMVNVLLIYAFANTHDISWGTKGQTSTKDLGSAKTNEKGEIEVTVPTSDEDINQLWLAMRKDLSVKAVEEKPERSPADKTADSFATYRTNVLLAVVLLNVVIVLFFTSSYFNTLVAHETGGSAKTSYYMTFLFWSVAGLSAFRCFGSVVYLLLRLVGH